MSDEPSFFAELKQIITDYAEARLQLCKIGAYEKIAKVSAVLFSSLFIAMVGFFFLLFLGISAGFFFGDIMNSNTLGFLTVAGVYFILFAIIIIFRKKLLENYIIDKVIQKLFEKEEND